MQELLPRRRFLTGASALVASCLALPAAAAQSRRITMINAHTDEVVDLVYFSNGRYRPDAIETFSEFARDWRAERVKRIDPRSIDIVWSLRQQLGTDEPTVLLSGYRTRQTNSRLRGASQTSFHLAGMAMDIRQPDRGLKTLGAAALDLGAGGVGIYRRSNFIHIDSGPVRSWSS